MKMCRDELEIGCFLLLDYNVFLDSLPIFRPSIDWGGRDRAVVGESGREGVWVRMGEYEFELESIGQSVREGLWVRVGEHG